MRLWMFGWLALAALGCGGDEAGTDPDGGTTVDTASTPTADTGPACDVGYADCNANPDDGCEASLLDRLTCGSCDAVCGAGQRCGDAGCVDLAVTSPLQTGVPASALNFDADGFVYLGGSFSQPTDFGDGVRIPVGGDIYVARYTPEGRLDWVETVPVPADQRDFPYHLALGPDDSIYITGELEAAANFGDGVVRGNASDSYSHAFVASWTESGLFRWADAFTVSTSFADTLGYAVAASDSRAAVVGRTVGLAWYLGTYDAISGASDPFEVFDTQLEGGQTVIPYEVAIAPGGNVFAVGSWSGRSDFGDGLRIAGRTRGWISSYTPGGAFRWYRDLAPAEEQITYVTDVAAPSDDAIYVAAYDYNYKVNTVDSRVVRFDGLGNESWSVGSTPQPEGWAQVGPVTVDGDVVYAALAVRGTVRFDDIVLESTASVNPDRSSFDVAVVCWDVKTRAVRWAVVLGNASDDGLKGIAPNLVAHDGVVHLAMDVTGPLVLPDGTVLEPAGTPSTNVIRISE